MRFRLDPLSASGVSVVEERPVQRSQGHGYIGETKISGLLTAGSNVTITGQGTKDSPYTIASSGGGGGGGASDHLTDASGGTVQANDQASIFGSGIHLIPDTPVASNIESSYGLYIQANTADDGSGSFDPFIELSDSGAIRLATSAIGSPADRVIQLRADGGVQITSTGSYVGVLDASSLTGNQTYTLPDADGTLALVENYSGAVMGRVDHGAVNSVARPAGYYSIQWVGSVEPLNATIYDTWVDTS